MPYDEIDNLLQNHVAALKPRFENLVKCLNNGDFPCGRLLVVVEQCFVDMKAEVAVADLDRATHEGLIRAL